LRNDEVGVALAHETVVCLADHPQRGVLTHSEDRVRIFGPLLLYADVMSPDTGVVADIEAEMPGDFGQIRVFGWADAAVREGDMEKPAEQIFEHRPIAREQTADLAGIALKPGCALAGEIKDQPHVIFFAHRDLKNLAKGRDLVPGNRTVGSRHLGAERDHRNRESDAAMRVCASVLAVAVPMPGWNVACRTVQQGAERPAKGQVVGTSDDSADNAHRSVKRSP